MVSRGAVAERAARMIPLDRATTELLVMLARFQTSNAGEQAPGLMDLLAAAARVETLLHLAEAPNACS
jgi:hypothetical protein